MYFYIPIYKFNKPSQKVPFPVKPELHEQVNDPSLLLQEEFEWQLLVPCRAHSSISGMLIDIKAVIHGLKTNWTRRHYILFIS